MSDAEIKDIIQEIETPFISGSANARSFRERLSTIEDIVLTRYDYTKDIDNRLRKISVPAHLLRSYLKQTLGALAGDIGLHLDVVGNKRREETAADRVEVMEAHSLMRLAMESDVIEDLRWRLAVGLAFTGWLEEVVYVQPEQAKDEPTKDYLKRVDQYRAAWFPYSFTSANPLTVAWMEQDRKVTIASKRYQLPLIDLVERYGSAYDVHRENPDAALRICNEHFGYLRGGDGLSDFTTHDMYTKLVEVCVVDDGATIKHYADLQASGPRTVTSTKGDRYQGIAETSYPNHFGAVSLLLASGSYHPDQPMAYRREGLLMDMINIQHAQAVLTSHFASMAATPSLIVRNIDSSEDDLPPLIDAPSVNADGQTVIPDSRGQIQQIEPRIEQGADKLFSILQQWEQVSSPRGLTFDPGASANAKATVALIDVDERDRLIAPARRSETRMWSALLDMVKHSRQHHLNSHRSPGAPAQEADWPYSFTTTGREVKIPGKDIERGKIFSISPQDLDVQFVRTVQIMDNRISTLEARGQRASRRWSEGTILWDERLREEGVENVTEFNRRKSEEMWYNLLIPERMPIMRQALAEFTALLNGTDVMEELRGIPVESMYEAASPGSQAPTMTTQSVAMPARDPAGGAPTDNQSYA